MIGRSSEATYEENPTKKVHMDPFAMLERKHLQNLVQVESDDQEDYKPLEKISISSKQTETNGVVVHVCMPSDYKRNEFMGEPNSHKYSFQVSHLLLQAFGSIQSNESALIEVNSYQEKKAIAFYAASVAFKQNHSFIYVSRDKNHCYCVFRDLQAQFGKVGLIMEGTTINKDAQYLVMTIQSLRKAIIQNQTFLSKTKWMILDDLLIKDQCYWQDLLISLPNTIRFIIYGEKYENAVQFLEWIAKLKQSASQYIYNKLRQQSKCYICPISGEGLYLINQNSVQNDEKLKKMNEYIETFRPYTVQKKKKSAQIDQTLLNTVRAIIERSLTQAIFDYQTKRQIEYYARIICTKYDLVTKAEKDRIQTIFNRSLLMLDEQDRKLPAIITIREILKKGVAMYHQGLLPIVKEIVELLFIDGLVKILVTNHSLPQRVRQLSKTNIITILKENPKEAQFSLPLATNLIIITDNTIEPSKLTTLLNRNRQINSSIGLSYHQLLNHYHLKFMDSQYILSRTYLQFQQQKSIPNIKIQLDKLQKKNNSIVFQDDHFVSSLHKSKQQKKKLEQKYREHTFVPQRIVPLLQIGRLVHLVDGQTDWGWGIIVNFHKKDHPKKENNDNKFYLVDCIVSYERKFNEILPKPSPYCQYGQIGVLVFAFSCITQISTLKLSNLPNDLNSESSKWIISKTMKNLTSKSVPLITIRSNDAKEQAIRNQILSINNKVDALKYVEPIYEDYLQKKRCQEEIKAIKKEHQDKQKIVLKKQLKAYRKLMKNCSLISKGIITKKGIAASFIESSYSVLLVHLIMTQFFNDMSATSLAAFLSAFIHQKSSHTERKRVSNTLIRQKLDEVLEIGIQFCNLYKQCKIKVEEEDYLSGIKEKMIDSVYEWANGGNFESVWKKTDVFEGALIATLQRLSKLIMQMSQAAAEIGDKQLLSKLGESLTRVDRGIVQTSSLYTF